VSHTIIARCVHGIEWLSADEVAAFLPAGEEVDLSRRELTFTVAALEPGLLKLRTVDDAFLHIGQIDGVGMGRDTPPLIARRTAALPLRECLGTLRTLREVPQLPLIDVVASIEGRRRFSRFAVEQAVGAAVVPVLGGTYLERTAEGRLPGEPDVTLRIFLRGPEAIVTMRLGRRPLHRRPYKVDTGPGTLHPPLAAAMVRLAGAPRVLLDPLCGDGTIVIESALSLPAATVLGGDRDRTRLAHARRNADRAGAYAALIQADVVAPPWRPGAVEAVVTNPPWNVGVAAAGKLSGTLDRFWRAMPGFTAPQGRVCLIVDADLDAPRTLTRLGYAIALQPRIRLAGRVSHLILCAPPGRDEPRIHAGAAAWRKRAIGAGVVTDTGF
jgi:23S rRNA G2445 N2-methylase RlmL